MKKEVTVGSNVLTSPAAILSELKHSMKNGNVVGIWSGLYKHRVFLTAVEHIIDAEIINDKLIILKSIDLQGIARHDNRIYLSEIEKLIPFNTKYDEHLIVSDDTFSDDSYVKIIQNEQIITPDDLKILLIRNINSGIRISLKFNNGSVKDCYIKNYLPQHEAVILSCTLESDTADEEISVPIRKIREVEFEFYCIHKGFSSKKFKIIQQEESQTLHYSSLFE